VNLVLTSEQARILHEKVGQLAGAAVELGRFGETDPDLAGSCGVEVCSLEARTILAGGYLQRIAGSIASALQAGQSVNLAAEDLEALSRLEGAVALGASRIELKRAALEAEAGQEGISKIGGLLGLATGAVGLYKSIF